MKTRICTTLLIMIILAACGESESVQKPINPNGDSGLALLMRSMADEAEAIKAKMAKGEAITMDVDHRDILTAEATEPEKAASAPYEAFATSYLQSVEKLKMAAPEDVAVHYDAMVNGCITSHQALCPGPLVRIEKLK